MSNLNHPFDNNFTLIHGDCLEHLKTLLDNSVDSIVTDPPYGLKFMGQKWDYEVPGVAIWQECLRVLKPGGHLLAFAGTRTQHRMTCNIEDAGFEIRDMIAWVYGSGFPKSLDVSKAIDKALGAEREITQQRTFNEPKKSGEFDRAKGSQREKRDIPVTESSKQWQGFGTALKPALEPITVARKPLMGTVTENVLRHGTGALNIEKCRVGNETHTYTPRLTKNQNLNDDNWSKVGESVDSKTVHGRWPANLIHDGSDDVLAMFPIVASGNNNTIKSSGKDQQGNTGTAYGAESRPSGTQMISYGDAGSAARFFYCAKASPADRHEGLGKVPPQFKRGSTLRDAENLKDRKGNFHPTVKPTDLMRYLCRLVTPKGGTVLDPFMGSGSTGKAAILEGFNFIGIEQEIDFIKISQARCQFAVEKYKEDHAQPSLFGEVAV